MPKLASYSITCILFQPSISMLVAIMSYYELHLLKRTKPFLFFLFSSAACYYESHLKKKESSSVPRALDVVDFSLSKKRSSAYASSYDYTQILITSFTFLDL
jgi:hypothetical protein